MKLLFDQNLSYKLVRFLSQLFPGSVHVKDLGFDSSGDEVIWNYAKKNGFVIVSKDSDFHQQSLVVSDAPKVIWIKKGNCSTLDIVELLKNYDKEIESFDLDLEATFLVIE